MSIPLKAKVSIRDNWRAATSPVQAAIKNLQDVLGLEVHCEPEWAIIISELDKVYEDKAQLVSVVTAFIEAWCVIINEILDDSTQEEWTEKVLTQINEGSSRLVLAVEVSESEKPLTTWSKTHHSFVLHIPNIQVYQPAQFAGVFKQQLLDCFDESKPSQSLPIHSTTGDEWADVGAEETSPQTPAPRATATVSVSAIEYLPDPINLPKPSTLLQKPPYFLFVRAYGSNKVEIECSHSPTLDVLYEYLKRWCRINPSLSNKPPAVAVTLNQGSPGFSVAYDTLTLFAENRYGAAFNVSPTLILSLVEGALGYERVFCDSSSWHYRRDTPYKKL